MGRECNETQAFRDLCDCSQPVRVAVEQLSSSTGDLGHQEAQSLQVERFSKWVDCAGDTFRCWNCLAIATDTTCHIINSTSLLLQKTRIERGALLLNSVLPAGFCEILSPVLTQLLPEMCNSRKHLQSIFFFLIFQVPLTRIIAT